jgi:phage terminase large subunit-like protein
VVTRRRRTAGMIFILITLLLDVLGLVVTFRRHPA